MDTWPEWVRTVVAPGQVSAGQGVAVAVPESEQQQLVAVTFRIVTSAVVATRTPVVSVLDGSGVALAAVAAGYGVSASSTADYSYVVGLAEWDAASTTNASGPLPPFPLREGDSITITVASIDVADQISRVRVTLLQRPFRP